MSQHHQTIILPPAGLADWNSVMKKLISEAAPGSTDLDCGDSQLGVKELQKIINSIQKSGLSIERITSSVPETIVSAKALGHQSNLVFRRTYKANQAEVPSTSPTNTKRLKSNLLFHSYTLRSGDDLTTEGDLLLYGDVNPGARISAGGDVMIWGTLRGVAHAGKNGDESAKIIALQLRPVQLRIAQIIARGPKEKPLPGLAEQARLVAGQIIIEPAETRFNRN